MAKEPFPLDRGWAWAIVAGCFVCVFFMVGTAKSTGLFLTEFENHFNVPTSLAAMMMGGSAIVYAFMAPVCIMLGQRFTVRQVIMTGATIGFIGMSLGSLLFSMEYVIATFGICFGIGNASIYGNCLVMLGLYFKKRRSLANGLALAGASIGQFALPPFIEFLLETFGLQGCLLLVGGVYFNAVAAASLFRPPSFWSSLDENVIPLESIQEEGHSGKEESRSNGCPSNSVCNGKKILHDGVSEKTIGTDCSLEKMILKQSIENKVLNDGAVGRKIVKDGDLEKVVTSDKTFLKDGAQEKNVLNEDKSEKTDSTDGDREKRHLFDGTLEKKDDDGAFESSSLHHGALKKADHDVDQSESNVDREKIDDKGCTDIDSPLLPSTPIFSLDESKVSSRVTCLDDNMNGTRPLTFKPHMASTGSLCRRPNSVYGSSLLYEPPSVAVEEIDPNPDPPNPTFCRTLLNMFDFSVMKSYVAVLLTLTSFLCFFGYFNFVLFLPATVLTRGIDKYEKAILVSVCGIGDLFGRLLIAAIGDRNFMQRYKLQALGIFSVGFNIGMLVVADSFWWMMVHCGLYGISGGVYVGLAAVVVIDFVGIKTMPRLLAVIMLIQGAGASIGQPLLGGIKDATGSYQSVMAICALSSIAGGIILLSYPLALRLESRRPERFRLRPDTTERTV